MIYNGLIIDHLYRGEKYFPFPKYNFFFAKKKEVPPQTKKNGSECIIINEYADRGTFYRLNKKQLLIPNISYLNLCYHQNFILINRSCTCYGLS